MRYVHSITSVLSDHLGWHRARLKFMARFTSALLRLTTTNLWKIALALKAGGQLESNYRRIQRFLSDYDMDFMMLARLLARLVPERPPYVVALDRTEWHFGQRPVNVLTVGIAHRGICFPVAWGVLPAEHSCDARAAATGFFRLPTRTSKAYLIFVMYLARLWPFDQDKSPFPDDGGG